MKRRLQIEWSPGIIIIIIFGWMQMLRFSSFGRGSSTIANLPLVENGDWTIFTAEESDAGLDLTTEI